MKLLGSSRINRSVCTINAVAKRHLDRQPPDREVKGEDIISSLNPNPRKIRIASDSALSLSNFIVSFGRGEETYKIKSHLDF
jgi:hypothetical protein